MTSASMPSLCDVLRLAARVPDAPLSKERKTALNIMEKMLAYFEEGVLWTGATEPLSVTEDNRAALAEGFRFLVDVYAAAKDLKDDPKPPAERMVSVLQHLTVVLVTRTDAPVPSPSDLGDMLCELLPAQAAAILRAVSPDAELHLGAHGIAALRAADKEPGFDLG